VWGAVQVSALGLKKTPTFSNPILKRLIGESIIDIGTTADCDDYVQNEAMSELRYFTRYQGLLRSLLAASEPSA
jgi:hypothetical protein